jgi:hypothetical protein
MVACPRIWHWRLPQAIGLKPGVLDIEVLAIFRACSSGFKYILQRIVLETKIGVCRARTAGRRVYFIVTADSKINIQNSVIFRTRKPEAFPTRRLPSCGHLGQT